MNVKELIEQLSYFDDDTEVVFSYDYGDHCHHMIAVNFENVGLSMVKHSDYIDGDIIADDWEDEDCREVVSLMA